MKLTLKRKVIALVVLAVFLPVVVMLAMMGEFQMSVSRTTQKELSEVAMMNITQIARDVYGLCETSNDLIQQRITFDLNVARELLERRQPVTQGPDTVVWDALNQTDQQRKSLVLPMLVLGGTWIGKNMEFSSPTPIVDDVKRMTGATCTIFQRMNEAGDMMRVATNAEGPDRKRALGTYMPAVNPDGTANPIIAAVLQGKMYKGLSPVFNMRYLTAYEALKDRSGRVIGMLVVGEKLESVSTLRRAIMNMKVGKTGFVGVLGGRGDQRGRYVISLDGLLDGESLWEHKDAAGRFYIQDMINKVIAAPKGEVFYQQFAWQSAGESRPRKKATAALYFEPYDWVIAATTFEDDYAAPINRVIDVIRNLYVKLVVAGILIAILFVGLSLFLARRIIKPLGVATVLAKQIAAGNLLEAKTHFLAAAPPEQAPVRRRFRLPGLGRFFKGTDETQELLDAFRTMTGNLDSLIGQVQRSGVQVTTSATEIAASARQLEATVAEQAASTAEVTATSKEISATAEDLVQTMDGVSGSLTETMGMAETGRTDLGHMEKAMRELMQATASISTKLATINDRANKISHVVTTINKISDQTNLLSLNAAIEAEKAGEYGRGFSVVAREISRLADQTAIATQDIEYVVKEMQSSVATGVMEMDKFADEVRRGVDTVVTLGGQLGGIIDQVRDHGPRFDTVKDGMHAQSEGAQQISEAMSQLSLAADQTKESLHEFKHATEQLNEAIRGLQSEVSRFKVNA